VEEALALFADADEAQVEAVTGGGVCGAQGGGEDEGHGTGEGGGAEEVAAVQAGGGLIGHSMVI
jgi:hypothetical protein